MSYIEKRMHHSIYAVCAYSMLHIFREVFFDTLVLFPTTAAVVGNEIVCSHLYLPCFFLSMKH